MSDSTATVAELKELVKRFCEEREWDQYHDPKELSIGISTEAAELLDIFRFKTKKQMDAMMKDEQKRAMIGEELADVLYFTLRFGQMNGFDLSDELVRKIVKNEEKYPVGKARGSNKKYNEG